MEEHQISIDAIVAAPENVTPEQPQSPGIPIDNAEKVKGRKRLLLGLQRISSSPSLAKMGRTPSSGSRTGYRTGGFGSLSCVSLASSTSQYGCSYGSSYSSELSAGFSTAPTSAIPTPGSGTPCLEHAARIRTNGLESPTSAALPSGIRPASRKGQAIDCEGDYFLHPLPKAKKIQRRPNFNFWADMPSELRMEILSYLIPKEIVRCSVVSKSWHRMCFDGQLWRDLDTSQYYRDIPADALVKIITSAGPFVRDLNLRGCVQLRERWTTGGLADACRNLENFSIEGCRIDRTSIHCFLLQNNRLVHINLAGLVGATNHAMKIIGQHCPKVEHLNISWCKIDTRGLRKVVEGCPNLKDLRAGEISGFDDVDFMVELFKRNTLERLILTNCDSLNDDSLTALVQGTDGEFDFLAGRILVPPRKLKHLDLTKCRNITDNGIKALAHNIPEIEGLQLSKNSALTDASLVELLPTLPKLTHLDLEELEELTNTTLQVLANNPCHKYLQHLSISYCENLGDSGMLPVLKACTSLATVDMDNTRISDLSLTEAAAMMRARNTLTRGIAGSERPVVGLRLVAYDCANVTWTGVREILSRNAEGTRAPLQFAPTDPSSPQPPRLSLFYPREIIQLKCFYNWQPTVEEHTKRVLRGDWAAAARLERKWAEWMMLNEEAGVGGQNARRRRRRAREAQMMHADEEEAGATAAAGMGIGGRRRRARSGPGACTVM